MSPAGVTAGPGSVDMPPDTHSNERSHPAPTVSGQAEGGGLGRLGLWFAPLLVAAVAYVPQLMAQPGVVSSDTKTYLYLDPGSFLRSSASLWDPSTGLGTVTHQQIGYLLPMGPFFWLFHGLGVPVWVAQRLWVGSILFAAGAGVLYLCRTLALRGVGAVVASLAYMLSPYFLQYVGRISVLLLPWAALPWLLAFTVLALRRGGWRDVARFGVVVALVSSINATSLLYVLLGPTLWLLYAVVGLREATWRRAVGTLSKLAVVSLSVSLWWITGLAVEAGFGVDVLRTTETVQTVSQTSTPIEVLRGVGYWYFYGTDRLGAWVVSSVQLTQDLVPLALSYAAAALSFLGAALTRWRYRAFFVLMVLTGLVFAVGVYPFENPTWFGHALKAFMTGTTAGLALRSADRATPLVLLAMAMLLGSGVAALARWSRTAGVASAALSIAVVVAANPPAFNGDTVATKYTQPAQPPGYTLAAARALNQGGAGTRVLGLPGADFAVYRYGDTTDSIYPALLKRGYVSREQLPKGSTATADLLYGLDGPIQVGSSNPNSLAAIARLMSVGDVLVQSDLDYQHYDQPRPALIWAALQPIPPGLGAPRCFGTPRPDQGPLPQVDEVALAKPHPAEPCPLEVLPVVDPRPIVRGETTTSPVVLDGDGEGLVDAAGVNLLSGNPTVLYGGTLTAHPSQLRKALAAGATVVVTDTNRRRAFRWDSIVDEAGQTLTASQAQPSDPVNSPINLFPTAPRSAATTASYLGVRSVTASGYGDAVTYLPEDRPSQALDGNTDTAWEVGAFGQPLGQWWQVQLEHPTTTSAINLVQPLVGARNRWITKATLSFDGKRAMTVRLGPASRTAAGQTITFPTRTFDTFRITIDATNLAGTDLNAGPSSVGFAEVRVAGASATELINLPSEIVGSPGDRNALAADRLVVLLNRQRVSPYPPRQDPETSLARSFVLPGARTFTLTGTARINALVPDDQIDRLVGRQQASGIVAYSKGRLPGDLAAGAAAALDGDPSTVWSPGFGTASQTGSWIHVDAPKTVTFDQLDLQVVDDGRHSLPTKLTVATENGSQTVTLPHLTAKARAGSVVPVSLHFPALHGRRLQVTFDSVDLRFTRNYSSRQLSALPIGIAELGIPGVQEAPAPTVIPTTCRNDLLSVDGHPISVQVAGTSSAALAGEGLGLRLCGADAGGLHLGPGRHVVLAANGHATGWNVDQLALDSAPGGGAMAGDLPGSLAAPPPPGRAPAVHVVSQSATVLHLRVSGLSATTRPFHLVLGESVNSGWKATIDGGPSLGQPELIDGFANGWMLDPAVARGQLHDGTLAVTLRWTPQRWVWVALVVSGAAFLTLLAVAVLPAGAGSRLVRRRRRQGLHARGSRSSPAAPQRATVEIAAGDAEVGLDDSFDPAPESPSLASPLHYRSGPSSLAAIVVTAVVTGALLAAVTRPWIGVGAGLATGLGLAVGRARGLLTGAAVGSLFAAGTVVVVDQATHPAQIGGTWAPTFGTAAVLAWVAVAALSADAVVEVVRRTRRRHRRPD